MHLQPVLLGRDCHCRDDRARVERLGIVRTGGAGTCTCRHVAHQHVSLVRAESAHRHRAHIGVLRRSEPVREVLVEVPVPVRGAPVAGAVARLDRRGVGLIGRVVVQVGRGLVLHVHRRGPTGVVRVPEDVPGLPRRIPSEVLARTGGVRVPLELPCGTEDLVEEAVVAGIARRGVGASLPHRDLVPPVTGPHVVDQALLLLQGRQDDLRVDAARLRDLVDDPRGALARSPGVRTAHRVRRSRARRVVPVLQAGIAGLTRRDHLLQEGLDLRLRHRGAVEEDLVADDVAGFELRQVGDLDRIPDRRLGVERRVDLEGRRGFGRCVGLGGRSRGGDEETGEHGEHSEHRRNQSPHLPVSLFTVNSVTSVAKVTPEHNRG